jgi:hypothetical protein
VEKQSGPLGEKKGYRNKNHANNNHKKTEVAVNMRM